MTQRQALRLYPDLSFLVLRIGLGVVFLVFGIGKFRGDEWADTMRSMAFFAHLPWKVDTSVFLAGIAEVATGLALIFGLFIRFFSLLASLELATILVLLYFQGIHEVRDIGLLAGSLSFFLCPGDFFSLDALRHKRL